MKRNLLLSASIGCAVLVAAAAIAGFLPAEAAQYAGIFLPAVAVAALQPNKGCGAFGFATGQGGR